MWNTASWGATGQGGAATEPPREAAWIAAPSTGHKVGRPHHPVPGETREETGGAPIWEWASAAWVPLQRAPPRLDPRARPHPDMDLRRCGWQVRTPPSPLCPRARVSRGLPDGVSIPQSAESGMPLVQSALKLTQSHHLSSALSCWVCLELGVFALSATFQACPYSFPDRRLQGHHILTAPHPPGGESRLGLPPAPHMRVPLARTHLAPSFHSRRLPVTQRNESHRPFQPPWQWRAQRGAALDSGSHSKEGLSWS